MIAALITMAVAAGLTVEAAASHAKPTMSCAQRWIVAHGLAPELPTRPKNPTPAEQTAYSAAQKIWRASYNTYQNDAAAEGARCIFGSAGPPGPSTATEAMALLQTAIGPNTTFISNPPKDVAAFCPNYGTATSSQRQQVWRNLFLAIIPHESRFKNASIMIDGDEYSVGLYQMSIHNGCAFSGEADAADPAKNTVCAVRKMEVLATPGRIRDTPKVKYGVIGGAKSSMRDGAAHYWSTLRYKVPSDPRRDTTSRGEILAANLASPGCR